MSSRIDLAGLLGGEDAAFRPVLHNCSLEGFGTQAYGHDPIRAAFRRRPAVSNVQPIVACDSAAAVIGEDSTGAAVGLYADVIDGRITRLWRLGPDAAEEPPAPTISVPADLDLDQRGGRLAFDPADHPALSDAHAAQVAALGEAWLAQAPPEIVGPMARARPLVLRGHSDGARAAALFRIQGAAEHGLAGFFVLAVLGPEGVTVAVDAAARWTTLRSPWRPSLRP